MAIAPAEIISPAVSMERSDTFWSRLMHHRLAQLGLVIVACLLFVALFAPLLSRTDPMQLQPNGLNKLGEPHPPGTGFLLGADTLGRDVWTRVLWGTRISLLVGICAMVTSVLIGTTIGLVGGYFGGWVDVVLTRLTEIVMSLPTILLAIALFMLLPNADPNAHLFRLLHVSPDPALLKLLIAITAVTWTGIARAVRGQVLSLKEQEFIEAARAIGCSHMRIIWLHLLPNVLPTVIVLATLATAHNILLEAGLSYLGLGLDPSVPSWGGTIKNGADFILSAPWIMIAPGVAIVLAVAGFNLLGQGLQETLEPRGD